MVTPPASRRPAGLLLTGGRSRRMGADKARILVGGTSLACLVAAALSAVADPAIEVGPGHSGLRAVREDPPGAGPLAALAAGWESLVAVDAVRPVLVVATDLPALTSRVLRWLADHPAAGSVVPVVGGRPQPLCARYSPAAAWRAVGLVAAGRRAMTDLLSGGDITLVSPNEWTTAGLSPDAFEDVDTPDDLDRFRALLPDPPTPRRAAR